MLSQMVKWPMISDDHRTQWWYNTTGILHRSCSCWSNVYVHGICVAAFWYIGVVLTVPGGTKKVEKIENVFFKRRILVVIVTCFTKREGVVLELQKNIWTRWLRNVPNIPKHIWSVVLLLHNLIFHSSYVIKRHSMASLMTSLKFCSKY